MWHPRALEGLSQDHEKTIQSKSVAQVPKLFIANSEHFLCIRHGS